MGTPGHTSQHAIIVGGGIVGATAALALAQSGLRVALIEAYEPKPLDVSTPDPRVFAITRASERIFSSLGVWSAIAPQHACAFTDMEVWDAAGSGMTHFDCAELGEPCLGHIVEPRFIRAALWLQLQADERVTLLCPAQADLINVNEDAVQVGLDNGQTISAQLLIAADGVNSPVRQQLDMDTHGHDYHQSSLVARVKTTDSHQHTAWQRFLPGGPLAFLPMQDGWSSIVWTMPSDQVERLQTCDQSIFHRELSDAFAHRLGDVVDSGEREAWPLRRLHADHYVQHRVALIGDAAHAIHPLAGQGVNLGLLDAAALAEVVSNAVQQGRNPGSVSVLRRYERWRRGDNLLMMAAMDGINQAFSNKQSVLSQLRNLGLSLVNRTALARRTFMRHAMGLGGDLPRLASANKHFATLD